MAEKKGLYTFKIDGLEQSIKESQKLKDNMGEFENWTIKAVSAQEVLQSILTSPEPMKNISKVITAHQNLNLLTEYLSKMGKIGIKQQQEVSEIREKNIKAEIQGAQKIDEKNKKELDAIKEKEHANWASQKRLKEADEDRLRHYKDANDNKIKDLDKSRAKIASEGAKLTKEIEENDNKREKSVKDALQNMQNATKESYAKQISNIKYKYALEEQEIKNSCDLTLAAESEKTGYKIKTVFEEVELKRVQNEKLKDLEKRKNEELKKAELDHQKATAAIGVNFIKERSATFEVKRGDALKKFTKSTKKEAKDAGDFLKGITEETMAAIVKQSAEAQKAEAEAAEAAKKGAAAKTAAATAATTAATAATKEAAAATKEYLDINKSRNDIKSGLNEFKEAQEFFQKDYKKKMELYDREIAAADGNAEKIKEIQARKTESEIQYGVNIIKMQQGINAAIEKEQSLGLTKWVQYAQQAEEIANSFKGLTDKASSYFSTTFTAISDLYKADIAAIDEDIKHLQSKNADITKESENQGKKVAAIQAQRDNAEQTGNTVALANLDTKLKTEKNIYQESLKNKEEIEAKERVLQEKKAKTAAKQERIEKLNRKATLIKNIGEATANVALGITNTLKAYPFPLNAALAVIVGAAGAIQIGIMTKQLAKFEDGGLLRGKRHMQGGMRIEGTNLEVEGGEFVVNRVSTDKNLGLVKYINNQRRELSLNDLNTYFARSSHSPEPSFKRIFAEGGQLPAINNTVNFDNENLIKAIQSIRIEPKVAVTDIAKVQESMVSVDGWVGV